MIQFILELCRRYRVTRCVLEENSAFALLSSSMTLRHHRHQLAQSHVTLIRVRSGKGDYDDIAISQLSALFYNNLLQIPTQAGGKKLFAPLVRQFALWRPGDKKQVRDIVKALQFAEKAARDFTDNAQIPRVTGLNLAPHLQAKQVTTILGEESPVSLT